MRTAFAPKLASVVAIAHAMFAMPERACVLFSSTSSLFGAPGQGNYAAANAALEGFALSRIDAGLATMAVQWGAWAAGMASATGAMACAASSGLSRLIPQCNLMPSTSRNVL